MNSTPTTGTLNGPIPDRAARPAAVWAAISRHALVAAQLCGAALLVHLYAIEGPAFERVFLLAAAGFIVNLALPMSMRLPFFVMLSIVGVVIVFGVGDAAWLLAVGMCLIAICHLPVPFGARVVILAAAGGLLAVSRGGVIAAPWSAAVWPILGSMFMFRLVLYMLAQKTAKTAAGPWWWPVAYFFMLPNLVFPLFPVIDYQTFRRTYYDKKEEAIHEQGMLWIARGLVHLLLYRFVYHFVLNDPADVIKLSDVVQFMLGTFLLYLRVSGQFHLIVGILHLFGFRLPETHKLYYLASSFTELWRRINIYWTEFMMKAVFYPTYFKVKRFGPRAALVLSTTAVFLTTWILHSYQWFWLRGGFPLTLQDTLFWGILGALVIYGALKELKAVKKVNQRTADWSWKRGLQAAVTFSIFCFLWSLWSTDSVMNWVWMLGAVANVDALGVAMVLATFGVIFVLGGRNWEASRSAGPQWLAVVSKPAMRTTLALAVLLIVSQPVVRGAAPKPLAGALQALHTTGLNAHDAALQHRGYYEQLDVRAQVNAEVLDVVGRNGAKWDDPASVGIIRDRKDLLLRDLYPSRSVDWNGNRFSTNSVGMRDKEYTLEKAPRTLRVALLGPSHVMGNGVADGETFESLVEDRLNREFHLQGYDRFEILNFAVDGYSMAQQVAMLEEKALAYSPDIVIATHYHPGQFVTQHFILKVAWGGIPVQDESLRAILAGAKLDPMAREGSVGVPFAAGRALAGWLGMKVRMPYGESEARARWIAEDVLDWSFRKLSAVSTAHGAVPVVLVLNAVIDDAPEEVPNGQSLERAQLRTLDLYRIFPEAERPALRVAPWDNHPNAAGHRLIAARLYEQLVGVLESGAVSTTASTGARHQFDGGHSR